MNIQNKKKSLTGHTSLWLTDFPYYGHRKKKQETNGIIISCFLVWQFMVHSMICMSVQPGFGYFGYWVFCDWVFWVWVFWGGTWKKLEKLKSYSKRAITSPRKNFELSWCEVLTNYVIKSVKFFQSSFEYACFHFQNVPKINGYFFAWLLDSIWLQRNP